MQCVIRNSTPRRNCINLFNLPWPGCSTHIPKPTPSPLSHSFALPGSGVSHPFCTPQHGIIQMNIRELPGSASARKPSTLPNISVVSFRPNIQITRHCVITSRHKPNAHVVTQTSRSRCSSVCLVITLPDTSWIDSRQDKRIFSSSESPRSALGPHSPSPP